MSELVILDTFPAFEEAWRGASSLGLEEQIEIWEQQYMACFPELLQLQLSDYDEEGMYWREIAGERIFPNLNRDFPAMQAAHDLLMEIGPEVFRQASEALKLHIQVIFVLYAGIGCGAGWVTKYSGKPAILFGLENIAAEGWAHSDILRGLVAHEIGHLAHFQWLEQAQISKGEGKWWQLFEEGVAQRCEHLILDEQTWHMAHGDGVDGWLDWCRRNQRWLAREYLRCLENDLPVKSFFGSWYEISGYKQTGYYLGHEVIRRMEGELPLRQIALLPDLEVRVQQALFTIGTVG